jgi:hypothetical protein
MSRLEDESIKNRYKEKIMILNIKGLEAFRITKWLP